MADKRKNYEIKTEKPITGRRGRTMDRQEEKAVDTFVAGTSRSKVNVTFQLPEPECDLLDEYARDRGMTRTAVLRQLIATLRD